MSIRSLLPGWPIAIISFALLFIQGCAVYSNKTGYESLQHAEVDYSELLGKEVFRFPLHDGNYAAVRVFNDRYSLKIHGHNRVANIEHARSVELLHSEIIGDRTVAVLYSNEVMCPHSTRIVVINGRELVAERLADCLQKPRVSVKDESLFVDYDRGNRLYRHTYHHGKIEPGRYIDKPRVAPAAVRRVSPAQVRPAAAAATPVTPARKPQGARPDELPAPMVPTKRQAAPVKVGLE